MGKILAVTASGMDEVLPEFDYRHNKAIAPFQNYAFTNYHDDGKQIYDYSKYFKDHLVIGDRDKLDEICKVTKQSVCTEYLQIIPYVVFVDDYENVLVYTRNSNAAELDQKYSIGFGGHIDIPDSFDYNQTFETLSSLNEFIFQNMVREIQEELGYGFTQEELDSISGIPKVCGIIYDPSTEVNKVHLGLVSVFNITWGFQNIPDNKECKNIEWVSLADIGTCASAETKYSKYSQYENWSQIVIDLLKAEDASECYNQDDENQFKESLEKIKVIREKKISPVIKYLG